MQSFYVTHRAHDPDYKPRGRPCRYFYGVHVHEDKRDVWRLAGGRCVALWSECKASNKRERRGWRVGDIHLRADQLRIDCIVHEARHAVKEWQRRSGCYREESECYALDWLVSRILIGLLKRKRVLFLVGSASRVNCAFYRQRKR